MKPHPPLDHIVCLECLVCGTQYNSAVTDDTCPDHGVVGTLDVVYDYEKIGARLSRSQLATSNDRTIWRYRQLLPVHPNAPLPPLTIGWTPLYRSDRLADELGLGRLWIKDDGRQPTASFKDRASAVAVVRGRQREAEVITTASTGNAAAALSGICASVGQRNTIFVPESAPQAKVAQLLNFGSTVMLVQGNYDQAFDLCVEVADEFGWYNRNTGVNPFMTEGKKTAMLELYEQLGGELPDSVFVSVGDGSIIGGLHKGLRDLVALGWLAKVPRLIGVQAEGSSFLVQAFENDEEVLTKPPAPAETVADSISAGLPKDRIKAMRAVKDTGGAFLSVTDDEILEAIPTMASGAGVFAEPAAAAGYAGLVKAVETGLVSRGERVAVISTGNGLKDIQSAMKAASLVRTEPHRVPASLDAVRAALGS